MEQRVELGGEGGRGAARASRLHHSPAEHLSPHGAVKVGRRDQVEGIGEQSLLDSDVERGLAIERGRGIDLP